GHLASRLDRERFALRNLASLPHISVAGACATGTHGSGWANQNLSAAVTGLELVTADGDIVELNRGDGAFDGAVVHLGALGAVTRLILELVPSFEVSQRVYEDLPLDVLDDHFAEIMAGGYSVSMFTDWRAPRLTQLWIKSLAEDGTPPVTEEPWFTATPAPAARNPVPALPPRVHPERRRRAAERVPAPRRTRGGRRARPAAGWRPDSPAAADRRDPHDRGRRAVAQPRLPPGQRGLPLHLAARHRRGSARGDADRAAAGPVRPAPALGQDLHHPGGRPPRQVRPPARFPRPRPALRPRGQVPQRLHR